MTVEMAPSSPGWSLPLPHKDGISCFRLNSWKKFFDFLDSEVFPATPSKKDYIWRGQRRSNWSISSSLDRLFDKLNRLQGSDTELETLSLRHLDRFKHAIRGRRGPNPPRLDLPNDYWALGQHFGLATPLVDWTRSPFAAAYFAFEEFPSDPSDSTEFRVVYALDLSAVAAKNDDILHGKSHEKGSNPILEVVDPITDENARLVSQGAVFTKAPLGMSVEQWVAIAFEGSSLPVLLRIEVPNTDRVDCLKALERMNINHLSLFPDLIGASRSTNLKLEIES